MSRSADSEQELLRRIRGGDPSAFEEIVRTHTDAVYRIVAGHLGPGEAEDVTQEVFVRVHQGLAKFRGDSALRTWIYRVAVNTALKRLRRRRRIRWNPLSRQPLAGTPGPASAAAASERKAALHQAIARLPEEQRAVVILRAFEGLSFEETAQVLDIRRPTAESRMARAKVRLRELLGSLVEEEQ